MKVIVLGVMLCLFIQTKGQTDTIVWQNKDSIPSFGRIDEASFIIDSNYYIIGGQDGAGNWYSQVWQYNIPSNTWQRMRDFPGGPITTSAGFAINGYGYVSSGSDSITGYNNDNEFWKYYPTVDTWQHKANYPGAPREAPISFVYNQVAFVGLGLGLDANDLWRYNATSDSWDSVSFIPEGPRLECGVSVVDSFAYIIAGFYNTTAYNDIWRYNINQDHWDSIGVMPGLARSNPLFWAFDSIIIVGYGEEEDGLMGSDIYAYNTKQNIWDTLTCINFPDTTADGAGAGCFKLGKTGFFFGGYKTYVNYSFYNNLWSFDASQFFPPDTPNGIKAIEPDVSFKVYPNPVPSNQEIIISTSLGGDISFSDELGQVIDERKIERGINRFSLNITQGVLFYKATLQDGSITTGKVVVY